VALSDYERRVLEEIETELRWIGPSQRRRRMRLAAALAGCLFLVAAVATVAVLFLPPAAVAATVGVVGLAAGFLFSVDLNRHRF
jgi:hypothetical protein